MSKRKLLLADDSVTIQKVVNLTFADEGIDVVTVGDGDAAMEKIAEMHPDVVLADVNMPGLTGYQICEMLRGNEATRNTPVVLLVGSFEPFDETEAARVGANAYLTKPFQSIRQLVSQVSDLMESTARSENGEAVASAADAPTELDDIDNLYHQSLSGREDVLGEDKPAVGDYGDFGMDDEIIETSYAHGTGESEFVDFEPRKEEDFADLAETAEPSFTEHSFASNEPEQAAEQQVEKAFAAMEPSETVEQDFGGFDPERFVFPPETPNVEEARRDDQMSAAFESEQAEPEHQQESTEPSQFEAAPEQSSESVPEFSAGIDHSVEVETDDTREPEVGSRSEDARSELEFERERYAEPTQPEAQSNVSESAPFAEKADEPQPAVEHDTMRMDRRFDTFSSDTANFDELDLLELPSIASGKTYELTTPIAAKESGSNTQVVSLSPELIEMIAQRVVEKLSEKY